MDLSLISSELRTALKCHEAAPEDAIVIQVRKSDCDQATMYDHSHASI